MTVEKISEVTRFMCSDGHLADTMEEACDYQERLEFVGWLEELSAWGRVEMDAASLAKAILESWEVKRKEQ